MDGRVYLDHAATTPLDEGVLQAMLPYMRVLHGNPSSVHSFGREALDAVEAARTQVAALIGARADEIVFTSGGTEADNLALRGAFWAMRRRGRNVIVVSAVEHEAVLETARALAAEAGAEVRLAAVDSDGRVDLRALAAAVDHRTALVSVMRAQNETGVVEDVGAVAALAHDAGALCHTDAVAAALGDELDARALGVDLLSLSAHKMLGPKGAGALFVRAGVEITRAQSGGGQERGLRAGSHDVPAIVGFGAAALLARREGARWRGVMRQRKEALWRVLEAIPGVVRTASGAPATAGTLHVRTAGAASDSVLIGMDREGVAVSAGSACSALAVGPSHVLVAMGWTAEEARSGIRFSLGPGTTEAEIARAAEAFSRVVERVRGARAWAVPG